MAKITTIIDIGSNSMRMVVFKKTSRFGFHLINETKSKVKLSQGCYENNGYLQQEPMQRAYDALESFLHIASNLKSRKILCVATSALRDAPNKKEFLSKVKNNLKLNIKIISGEEEAYFGAIAAKNLLATDNFTTTDIGGGSTEFALIKNNNIEYKYSLKIGTIRIKELFLDKNDFDGAKQYITQQLETLPNEFKNINKLVGLGGTIRALSRIIITNTNYPFDVLHDFRYKTTETNILFDKIIYANNTTQLKELGVRKDRYDTIVAGTFIFKTILEFLDIQTVITSGVGVREGVYLTDLLRNSNHKFPANFNLSVRSLLDRFIDDKKQTAYLGNNAAKLFDILQPLHNLDIKYKQPLILASKLHQIGIVLNFYKNSEHSSNFILHGLTYGFTHKQRVLIASILKSYKKNLPKQTDIVQYEQLLPDLQTLRWLSYMFKLNKILNDEFLRYPYKYTLENNIFSIRSNKKHYIILDDIKKLKQPSDFVLNFIEEQ